MPPRLHPLLLGALGVLLLLWVGACAPSSPTLSSPTPTPSGKPSTAPRPPIPTPPDRDLYSLAQRLRLKTREPIPTPSPPPEPGLGDRQTFWATNLETETPFQVTATLRLVTPHLYFYVEEGASVSEAALERTGREFEDKIYPREAAVFGPGLALEGGPRLTVLNARIPGVAGYFSSADAYPQVVHSFSNERLMLYINLGAVTPGSAAYYATLAHEFNHFLQFLAHPHQETWVNEGLAELAADLSGYTSFSKEDFLASPDTQLTAWAESPQVGPHYGAAFLFFKYFADHFAQGAALGELLRQKEDGIAAIDAFLSAKGYQLSFDDVFSDWVVANLLDEEGDGPYSYPEATVRARTTDDLRAPGRRSGAVHQYAARYLELRAPPGETQLSFSGALTTTLMPETPRSGQHFYWSNRGDSIDTALTRQFDLTGLFRATLKFWAWYDIENGWDYAYLEVSTNGGQTWQVIPAPHTSTENRLGNAFGPGYTGRSGPRRQPSWVEETVDLSVYAGQKILLRFEYVTDEALNKTGLFLDDIAIPELGFFDDAEAEAGWEATGFARVGNSLPQRYLLRLVRFSERPQVEALSLSEAQQGQWTLTFDNQTRRLVLVVAALAPETTEAAPFQVELR